MVNKVCLVCNSSFSVCKSRENTAKYCSKDCSNKKPQPRNMVQCGECGIKFHRKKSAQDRNKYWGNFCSVNCSSKFRSRILVGDKNPNFKNRNYDNDGYRIYVPQASLGLGFEKIKVHHAVTFESLGIRKIPDGYHVHHKDCNVENNDPLNLQLISNSDHKWIHKEYGSASLWALQESKIDASVMAQWSSDRDRAYFLLMSNLINQAEMLKGFDVTDIKNITERLTNNKGYFYEI